VRMMAKRVVPTVQSRGGMGAKLNSIKKHIKEVKRGLGIVIGKKFQRGPVERLPRPSLRAWTRTSRLPTRPRPRSRSVPRTRVRSHCSRL